MKLSRYYFMFAISLLLFCSCSKKTSPASGACCGNRHSEESKSGKSKTAYTKSDYGE